jgi:glycosyltransferase involved in cell wall biosynthesis
VNVGYYFHPQVVFDDDGSVRTEAHWGYFVRALAREAGTVTFYGHPGEFSGTETLPLRPEDNVRAVSLGARRQQPKMLVRPGPNLEAFDPAGDKLDVMLVRCPTPMLWGFARKCRRAGVPMVGLVVADLAANWRPTAAFPWWRNRLIKLNVMTAARVQRFVGKRHLMLAISDAVVSAPGYTRTAIVPTTSLSEADLTGPSQRTRAFPTTGRIRLLFTGRLVEEKGLLQFGEALADLVRRGHDVELELVGASYGDSTIDTMLEQATRDGVADRIIVSGFLEAGPALLAAYERADIYVLPTHGEGSVTRTIKEAFASGVPVVTTTIRSHLEFLRDGDQAVLVEPRSANALADGIERVIRDAALRDTIARNGFEWVKDYTNERSAAIVTEHLRNEIARAR